MIRRNPHPIKIILFSGILILLTACAGSNLETPAQPVDQGSAEEQSVEANQEIAEAQNNELDQENVEEQVVESKQSVVEGENSTIATAEPKPTEMSIPPTRSSTDKYEDLEIITLLPRDAIPAIDNPQFLSATEADEFYDPDELVMGVTFDGDTRAYSVPFLSNHEIVNDMVGGVKIAVTW